MKLSTDIENYDKHYIEITRNDNDIIFHLKNSIFLTSNYLIIKHRKSNKRLIKKFNNSKLSLSIQELFEFREIGFFDIYIKINFRNNTYIKRIPFKSENDISIDDTSNLRKIKFYETINGNLSIEYQKIIKQKVIDNNFKVTAVVLVYNGEPYLKKCLNSLVNQSLDNLEILLINDASTDNSLKICKNFKEKYSNVFLINKTENKGLAHSVNLGIKHAKGEYVIFVDNDDIIPRNAYEKLYNKAKETDADVSIGKANFLIRYQSEMNFLDITPWKQERIVTDLKEYPDLFYDVFYWNKLIKRDLLIENNIEMPESIKYYGDRCFTHRVYSYASKISIIPDCVYLWRKRDDSLSRIRFDVDNFNDRMNAYDYDLDYLSDFYPNYFNTLFRRALFPIKGILESEEFEKVFFDRVLKFFKKGLDKVEDIYENNFNEIVNIYAFLIINGHFDELRKLLEMNLKNENEILNENNRSYWVLPQFRNSNLNIPDELFEIRYLQKQFINIDEIVIDDENITFSNIELPKYFDFKKGEIVLKGRAYSKDNYDELCHAFEVEKISNENVFTAKIPLDELNLFEVYSLNFRFVNKYGYSKDIKLSSEFIKNIVNKNDNIKINITSRNHIFIIIQQLKDVFDVECSDEELLFSINNSNKIKKDFKLYLINKYTNEQLFLDFDLSIYKLKWKFFLEDNSNWDIFMRIYNDKGKLNKIIKVKPGFINNFNNSIVNKNIGIELYGTENGNIELKSF